MKTFENFIESEAFFPVLILLLVMLVGVFMWIILSNKKEAQKRRNKKNIKIDEDAEIKIFSDGDDDLRVRRRPARKEEDDEPERSEIAIVEEVKDTAPIINFNMKPKEEEIIYDIPLPNFNEGRFTETSAEEEEIDYSKIDYGDLSVPPVPDIFKEEDEVKIGNAQSDNVDALSAFNSHPTGDTEIHDDIKVEEKHEYVGEKTEVFDFPAFDDEDIFSTGDIETEIINAAENYIKDIMSNR